MQGQQQVDALNSVGDVPLAWYRGERHLGYNNSGSRLFKDDGIDSLEMLLQGIDDRSSWRTLFDKRSGHRLQLSVEEVKMIKRLGCALLPATLDHTISHKSADVATANTFTLTEPKRRFVQSKHEAKRVLSMVRHLRRFSRDSISRIPSEEVKQLVDIWSEELLRDKTDRTVIRAARAKRAGHELSYNTPSEYASVAEYVGSSESTSLRCLRANANFVKDCFNRCLDLYLCPRVQKEVLQVDPSSILPEVPELSSLKPFPNFLSVSYNGHSRNVSSVAISPGGDLICSGAGDGFVRVWELATGRCVRVVDLGEPVVCVSWRPGLHSELAICSGKHLTILSVFGSASSVERQGNDVGEAVSWFANEFGSLSLSFISQVVSVTWHNKGDYFASIEKHGRLCVHQLSSRTSQAVFSSPHQNVTYCLFHPHKPVMFITTQHHVKVFDVREHRLLQKLKTGNHSISGFSIDGTGEIVAVCTSDSRVYLFDVSVSSPIKVIQLQSGSGLTARFHQKLPLFSVSMTNGSVQIFHLKFGCDLLQSLVFVPLKLLRVPGAGTTSVSSCSFHPVQPWIVCARGAVSFLYTE